MIGGRPRRRSATEASHSSVYPAKVNGASRCRGSGGKNPDKIPHGRQHAQFIAPAESRGSNGARWQIALLLLLKRPEGAHIPAGDQGPLKANRPVPASTEGDPISPIKGSGDCTERKQGPNPREIRGLAAIG